MRASDIQEYLVAQIPQYEVFYSQIPPDPDACLAVFAYGPGELDLHILGFDERAFQVRARGVTYDEAERMAEDVYSTMHGVANAHIGEWLVRYILAMSVPVPIGKDDKQRHEFTINFRYKAHAA